jgi:hypothetical protein
MNSQYSNNNTFRKQTYINTQLQCLDPQGTLVTHTRHSDNTHRPLWLTESFKSPELSAVGLLSRDISEAQYMHIMQIQPLIHW